jgi:hypothetical protein
MRRLLVLGACGILVAWLTVPVMADWDPSMGYKMHFPQLPDLNGWDVDATYPKVLADDWQCSETGPITDVHFWGSWQNDQIGQIQWFHVSIHADVPAQGTIPSHPGEILWQEDFTSFAIRGYDPSAGEGWYNPNTGYWNQNDHQHYFQYNITNIPNPYYQAQGQIYWLDISAHVAGTTGSLWGWKTSLNHWNDDAVWGDFPNPAWQELIDPVLTPPTSLDLAFVITPEPAAFVLLAVGLLVARRR